jgi:hypothetical protein
VSKTRTRNSIKPTNFDSQYNSHNLIKVEKLEENHDKIAMPLINLKSNKLNPYEADCDNIKRINQ